MAEYGVVEELDPDAEGDEPGVGGRKPCAGRPVLWAGRRLVLSCLQLLSDAALSLTPPPMPAHAIVEGEAATAATSSRVVSDKKLRKQRKEATAAELASRFTYAQPPDETSHRPLPRNAARTTALALCSPLLTPPCLAVMGNTNRSHVDAEEQQQREESRVKAKAKVQRRHRATSCAFHRGVPNSPSLPLTLEHTAHYNTPPVDLPQCAPPPLLQPKGGQGQSRFEKGQGAEGAEEGAAAPKGIQGRASTLAFSHG